VDISVLEEIDQAIHVRDLPVDEAVEVLTEPDQVVVHVLESKVEKLVEEIAEEAVVEAEEAEEVPSEEAEGKAESEAA
jgi:large subunit ribosomal protein L25